MGVVINSRSEILEISPCAAQIATLAHIGPAAFSIHLRQSLAAPEVVKATDALVEFPAIPLTGPAVIDVDGEHVRNIDVV